MLTVSDSSIYSLWFQQMREPIPAKGLHLWPVGSSKNAQLVVTTSVATLMTACNFFAGWSHHLAMPLEACLHSASVGAVVARGNHGHMVAEVSQLFSCPIRASTHVNSSKKDDRMRHLLPSGSRDAPRLVPVSSSTGSSKNNGRMQHHGVPL